MLKEEIHNITLYHGTPAKNLKNILSKGLRKNTPLGGKDMIPGVYLTSDIELAARYSAEWGERIEQYPVQPCSILEIYLSKNKRIKKLRYDPLDRLESLYNEYERPENSTLAEIEDIVNKILSNMGIRINFEIKDIEQYDGINIFKLIINLIKRQVGNDEFANKNFQINLKFAIGKIIKSITNYENEFIVIKNDGTIKIMDDIYSQREQLIYPKDIHFSTIKYIWLRENDLDNGFPIKPVASSKFGFKLIPAEIQEKRENYEEMSRKYSNADEYTEYEEIEEDLTKYGIEEANEILYEIRQNGITEETLEKISEIFSYYLEDTYQDEIILHRNTKWNKYSAFDLKNYIFGNKGENK